MDHLFTSVSQSVRQIWAPKRPNLKLLHSCNLRRSEKKGNKKKRRKCLTGSVGREVEIVSQAAVHRSFLEVRYLVHVLQVQSETGFPVGDWLQAKGHALMFPLSDTHNPEGVVFDLSGEAQVFISPPLVAVFTGVVWKDGPAWPHLPVRQISHEGALHRAPGDAAPIPDAC